MAESEIIIIEEGNIEVEVKEYYGGVHEHIADNSIHVTSDQSDALDGANSPSAANPVATMNDVGGGSGEANNATGSIKFTNIFGTWINSPDTPLTVPITFDFTNALNGAITAVYYQAATLDIIDPDNRIVIQSADNFIINELCLVWFAYDAGNGAIHVNVQAGDTGNRPVPVGNVKPVITMLGTSPVEVIQNNPYIDAGATAYDTEDGDITADIVTVTNVNTAIIGGYTVTYNVQDSEGLAAIEVVRIVNVISNVTPVPDAPIDLILTEVDDTTPVTVTAPDTPTNLTLTEVTI